MDYHQYSGLGIGSLPIIPGQTNSLTGNGILDSRISSGTSSSIPGLPPNLLSSHHQSLLFHYGLSGKTNHPHHLIVPGVPSSITQPSNMSLASSSCIPNTIYSNANSSSELNSKGSSLTLGSSTNSISSAANPPNSSHCTDSTGRSSPNSSFAAALRSLAKQATVSPVSASESESIMVESNIRSSPKVTSSASANNMLLGLNSAINTSITASPSMIPHMPLHDIRKPLESYTDLDHLPVADPLRGFQPYRSSDVSVASAPNVTQTNLRPPHPLEMSRPYQAFSPLFTHPLSQYRLEEHLYLEHYGLLRPPLTPYAVGAISSLYPGVSSTPYLPPRYSQELHPNSLSNLHSTSALLHERLKLEGDLLRQREYELGLRREREVEREHREKDRDRSRDRDKDRGDMKTKESFGIDKSKDGSTGASEFVEKASCEGSLFVAVSLDNTQKLPPASTVQDAKNVTKSQSSNRISCNSTGHNTSISGLSKVESDFPTLTESKTCSAILQGKTETVKTTMAKSKISSIVRPFESTQGDSAESWVSSAISGSSGSVNLTNKIVNKLISGPESNSSSPEMYKKESKAKPFVVWQPVDLNAKSDNKDYSVAGNAISMPSNPVEHNRTLTASSSGDVSLDSDIKCIPCISTRPSTELVGPSSPDGNGGTRTGSPPRLQTKLSECLSPASARGVKAEKNYLASKTTILPKAKIDSDLSQDTCHSPRVPLCIPVVRECQEASPHPISLSESVKSESFKFTDTQETPANFSSGAILSIDSICNSQVLHETLSFVNEKDAALSRLDVNVFHSMKLSPISRLDNEERRLKELLQSGLLPSEAEEMLLEESQSPLKCAFGGICTKGLPIPFEASHEKLSFLGTVGLTTHDEADEVELSRYERRAKVLTPLSEGYRESLSPSGFVHSARALAPIFAPRLGLYTDPHQRTLFRNDSPDKCRFLQNLGLHRVKSSKNRIETERMWRMATEDRLRRYKQTDANNALSQSIGQHLSRLIENLDQNHSRNLISKSRSITSQSFLEENDINKCKVPSTSFCPTALSVPVNTLQTIFSSPSIGPVTRSTSIDKPSVLSSKVVENEEPVIGTNSEFAGSDRLGNGLSETSALTSFGGDRADEVTAAAALVGPLDRMLECIVRSAQVAGVDNKVALSKHIEEVRHCQLSVCKAAQEVQENVAKLIASRSHLENQRASLHRHLAMLSSVLSSPMKELSSQKNDALNGFSESFASFNSSPEFSLNNHNTTISPSPSLLSLTNEQLRVSIMSQLSNSGELINHSKSKYSAVTSLMSTSSNFSLKHRTNATTNSLDSHGLKTSPIKSEIVNVNSFGNKLESYLLSNDPSKLHLKSNIEQKINDKFSPLENLIPPSDSHNPAIANRIIGSSPVQTVLNKNSSSPFINIENKSKQSSLTKRESTQSNHLQNSDTNSTKSNNVKADCAVRKLAADKCQTGDFSATTKSDNFASIASLSHSMKSNNAPARFAPYPLKKNAVLHRLPN